MGLVPDVKLAVLSWGRGDNLLAADVVLGMSIARKASLSNSRMTLGISVIMPTGRVTAMTRDSGYGSNAVQDERIGGGGEGCTGEKSSLLAVQAEERGPSSTIVLDYAHRLSHDILEQAVKQWAVTESRYSDIPFIESDVP
ncbi:hypothetical protein IHE44_0014283 [Lamprotornis superbus]|uniref:Small membrane A-kinase anchor protein n=1 Tax=Lamprotornis superbus TaxID=245042 RepID=A0A835NN62_9PASS|nr:hypothetical protein IHE44_0014283 [Lamprotornis superbus]